MTNKELQNIIKEYTDKQRRYIFINATRDYKEVDKLFEKYNKEVEKIYSKYVKGVYKADEVFRVVPSTPLHIELNKLTLSFQSSLYSTITTNIFNSFSVATANFSTLTDGIFPNTLSDIKKEYRQVNEKAREQFINRNIKDGRTLKGRCWLLSKQYLRDIEDSIAIGINKGDSAKNIGKRLQTFITDIEAKREEIANIKDDRLRKDLERKLPKPNVHKPKINVKYHSEMLARNETNLAYRSADRNKMLSLPQVVGMHIKVSNSHQDWLNEYWIPKNGDKIEVCDAMTGKYPTSFDWKGWHPNCKCYSTPILKTLDELADDIIKLGKGENVNNDSANSVKDIPANAKQWIKENYDRISEYSNPPYWWSDNIELINKVVNNE